MIVYEDELLKQFIHWMINDLWFRWEGSQTQTIDIHAIEELVRQHHMKGLDSDSTIHRALRLFLEVYESYFSDKDAAPSRGLSAELELLSKKYPWRQIVDTVHRIDTGEAS